jgi:hypothetical protein
MNCLCVCIRIFVLLVWFKGDFNVILVYLVESGLCTYSFLTVTRLSYSCYCSFIKCTSLHPSYLKCKLKTSRGFAASM